MGSEDQQPTFVEDVASVGGGEISPLHILSHSSLLSNQMLAVLVITGLVVVGVALVGLIAGGRWRRGALELATLTIALGPLLGLLTAAYDMSAGLGYVVGSSPPAIQGFMWVFLLSASYMLFAGAAVGIVGVVMRVLLKVVPERRRK